MADLGWVKVPSYPVAHYVYPSQVAACGKDLMLHVLPRQRAPEGMRRCQVCEIIVDRNAQRRPQANGGHGG